MRFAVTTAVLLSVAWSTLAYFVTSPQDNDVWRCGNDKTVTWDFVNTDANDFAILLTDQNNEYLLAENVPRNRGRINVRVPRAPESNVYRVNLIKNAQEKHTIYAQSGQIQVQCSSA